MDGEHKEEWEREIYMLYSARSIMNAIKSGLLATRQCKHIQVKQKEYERAEKNVSICVMARTLLLVFLPLLL